MPPMPEPAPTTRKLTYEDYCRIPDDGLRHEILDGVHVVSEVFDRGPEADEDGEARA